MARAGATTSTLVHSKRHGELVLDAASQRVQMVYPRVNRFFHRKFDQPRKCIMSRQLLQVISGNGKQRFMCRFLCEEDASKCLETLRSFGVEVIVVVEKSLLSTVRVARKQEETVMIGGEAALQTLRATSPGSIRAEVRDYGNSSRLQDDTKAILQAMFSMDS
ncbi:unnamed protein product [Hyaloperonospora brassicae]|uniref:Uncharacterized protein n=1 Tax=Hyaloperonospora brassicae TaxID=162125 RepID=A0AAV0UER3_HYABA|nr:unnamed protein product [Hyaloperonospora brassicae]